MDVVAGPSDGLLLPPGGLFEIVFSFDTTGSMSRVIDEVKGRIQDMIQRLQADIPGIRIGVIAHGDYCDRDVFYLEKHIDLTTNIVQLTDFVNSVDGTGGGDPEECYEYILALTKGLNWTPTSRKALVMIGDSVPHEPDYELNVDKINWREATNALAEKGIKIYSVQAFEDEKATDFFEALATMTDGHHLKLADFSNICDFIMAICYRERGDEYLEGYEAEVRAREARKGLHKDLEGLFGVLRRGDSSASNKSALAKTPSSVSDLNPVGPLPTMLNRISSSASSSSGPKTAVVAPIAKPVAVSKKAAVNHVVLLKKKGSVKKKDEADGSKKLTVKKIKDVKTKRTVAKQYRHRIPDTEFVLKQHGLANRWTNWTLALSVDKTVVDKGTWVERKRNIGWRKRQLFPKSEYSGKALYEIAVQKGKGCKLHVMQARWCALHPSDSNWERRLIKQRSKTGIHNVLKNGGRVFTRRFIPWKLGKVQRNIVDTYRNTQMSQYAWHAGAALTGHLSWATC